MDIQFVCDRLLSDYVAVCVTEWWMHACECTCIESVCACVFSCTVDPPLLIFALRLNVLQLCHANQGRGQQKCLVAIGTRWRTRQQRSIVWWKRDEGGGGVRPGMDRRWTAREGERERGAKGPVRGGGSWDITAEWEGGKKAGAEKCMRVRLNEWIGL